MTPTSATDYMLPSDHARHSRAVMCSSRGVAGGGRGGRPPSGAGGRPVPDLVDRDFAAEIAGR